MQFTILVVDDDAANIRLLCTLLKRDYKVVVAKSGQTALELAASTQPELILLDVVMPDMNGFSVLKSLKQNPLTLDIPVIMVTGLQSDEDEEMGLQLGASDYIQKPFHLGIVKARVKNQLDLIRKNQLLEQVADIDALTELPNRRRWQKDLQQLNWPELDPSNNIAIGILDIDNFKEYNDYYGHTTGDKTLMHLAHTIEQSIKNCGATLYRFGSQGFVFLIYDKTLPIIEECINAIGQRVEAEQIEHKASKVKPVVTISGGACIQLQSRAVCCQRMFERADALLYKVKKQGKNQIQLSHLYD